MAVLSFMMGDSSSPIDCLACELIPSELEEVDRLQLSPFIMAVL